MGNVLYKFGRPLSEKHAVFFDRISSVGRNHRGLLTWMASCATAGCSGELPLEMLRRHGNQICNDCRYAVVFGEGLLSKKLEHEKHRVVAVAKIKGDKGYLIKDWYMRCAKESCFNVFRCYEFIRYDINFCSVHRPDKRRRPPYVALYNYCKAGAKVRGKKWLLTLAEFSLLCRLPFCFYCRSKLERMSPAKSMLYPGYKRQRNEYTMYFDRVDSSKGYFAGNVVPCCGPCNVRKQAKRTGEQYLAITAKLRGDEETGRYLADGMSWRQVFETFAAPYLSASEFKQICP